MNILVLGSGGREHALVKSIVQSTQCDICYVAPGNGGTAQIATNVALDQLDAAAVAQFCKDNSVGVSAMRTPSLPLHGTGATPLVVTAPRRLILKN